MSATLQAPAVFSPARGGADPLAAVKQLVLDAVSSPLTRAMYARARSGSFRVVGGTRPAGIHAGHGADLAPASIHQKLSAVRKLTAEASYNGLLDPAAAQAIREVRGLTCT